MNYRIILLFALTTWYTSTTSAQESTIPYHEIENYPENYAPGNILSRFIDGLGYRYYWSTEGLSDTDLAYRPTDEARSSLETIEHIYDLSASILAISESKINKQITPRPYASYEDLRKHTLLNLQAASKAFANKSEAELAAMSIKKTSEVNDMGFPLWHIMNGQISDAIYHTGQLASFRRSTGNPVNKNVSVFMGKNR